MAAIESPEKVGIRPVHEFEEGHWDAILRTNLTGPFLMTKYAVPELLKAGRAAIVM